MKRFLSVFLCLLLLFRISVPAFASEIEEHHDEVVDFAYNFVGDSIIYTMDNGTIISVEPNDMQMFSAAGAGTLLLTSAGGVMGTGTATIASAALPILSYVLAAGAVVASVYGLAQLVMNIYFALSDTAKAECADIVASGEESFVLSPELAAELSASFNDIFFTDDGSFISSGLTFSPENMLVYSDGQRIRSNYASAVTDIYKYALSDEAVPIDGTSLAISLVSSPFDDYTADCLRIFNSVTGASLTYTTEADRAFLGRDCGFYTATAPTVATYDYGDGSAYHTIGFWILHTCEKKLAGETCSNCIYTYQSLWFGDSIYNANVRILFENTGIAGLDGIQFRNQHLKGVRNFTLYYPNKSISIPYTVFEIICTSLAYTVGTAAGGITVPKEEDKIYVAPADALADANKLTQTGATTGTWAESVTVPDAVPDVEADTGTLAGTTVGKLMTALGNLLKSLFKPFIDMLIDALKALAEALFIPEEGFFEEFIASITATFEDRMGLLTYPLSLLFDFLDHLLDIGTAEPVFRWGSWSYEGIEVIPAGSYNFNDMLENETVNTIHDIYLLMVDVGIVFGLVNLLRKKYESVVSN